MRLQYYQCCVIVIIASVFCRSTALQQNKVHILEQGSSYRIESRYHNMELHVFCYVGKPKYIIHIWQTVTLQLDHPSDDYTQYEGPNPDIVEKDFLENRYGWSFSLFSSKQKNIKIDPFNSSCIGLVSRETYTVHLNVIRIDLWKLLWLMVGVSMFLSADTLSKNTIFHYICGVAFGICGSFMIMIYVLSKLFPRKPFMYGVLGAGWTIVIYVFQLLLDNLRIILSTYRLYVIWYITVTGFISFIVCYRWGRVENQRTINLIRWSLQAVGVACIMSSSHYREAAAGQSILLILVRTVPTRWIMAPKCYWKRKFPPKVKMLNNDEYYEQGVRETSKALEELRVYCRSPKCDQWKTALRIKDVKRFASFVEGNSHLSDDEVLEYETSIHGDITDDELSGDFTEEDEESY